MEPQQVFNAITSIFPMWLMSLFCLLIAIVHFWEAKVGTIYLRKVFIGAAWLQIAFFFGLFTLVPHPIWIIRAMLRYSLGILALSYIGYKWVYIDLMIRESALWKRLSRVFRRLFRSLRS